MKIILDLDHSINNYNWTKEELEKFVLVMLDTLWALYNRDIQEDILTDEEKLRLYDILDMFNKYDIKGDE